MDYRHKDAKRKNNPEEGLATYLPEEHETRRYEYDPHLDPQLVWAGKAEHTSFNVPLVPLYVQERVSPISIVDVLKKRKERQAKLFDEGEYPIDKRVDFYKHDVDWANRLILGDSLLVMNSLLTKELLGGQVQMIYVDPPYGVNYASNFQPTLGSHDVKQGKDESLTREPEQIKAYRDTWELGVHSYLTYLRDRLLLARELLAASGSIFVQISDDNLGHVRELMDEIFGVQNRISIIILQKTSISTSAELATVNDFILWYGKDKSQVKYHQLFREKTMEREGQTYSKLVGPKGEIRGITEEERRDGPPKGWRLATLGILTSPSPGSRYPVDFKGKTYWPTGQAYWKTDSEGMRRLIAAGRVAGSESNLRYIRYWDDFSNTALNNMWTDAVSWGFGDEKLYVVQTNYRIVERCLLMTTDPGDLVVDPTCGSGTTAFVAEKWGRRWMTCDTSRVAFALARQRLLTSAYPYYRLAHPEEGLKSGFEYETTAHLTLGSVAQNEQATIEVLYDRPLIDKSVARVSGPFTVEGIPAPAVEVNGEKVQARQSSDDYLTTLVEAAKTSGFVISGGNKMRLENVIRTPSAGFIHAEGVAHDKPAEKVAISFGPRYGRVGPAQVEEAVRTATANGYGVLLVAGFDFEPAAQAFVGRTPLKVKVQFAHISPDMETHDLLKQTKASQLFTIFGEPDLRVESDGRGNHVVSLLGVDVYDPTTGENRQTGAADVPAWFLDEDYDGFSFNICQAFFPEGATRQSPWDKLANALRGTIDAEKMAAFKGNTSMPFERGPHGTAAVKVVDQRGVEAMKIVKLRAK